MNTLHQGMVLRTYIPQKQKLSIFDLSLGRISCVPQGKQNAERLFHGALISYALKEWGTQHLVYDITLLSVPEYTSENNFLFFHHVLELCYYFLPLHSEESTLFALVKLMYTHPELLRTELAQKLFICHFFRSLGVYPPDTHSYDPSFFRLISGPFDSKVNAKDEEKVYSSLRKWLLSCVSTHPYVHYLKTIDFLKK